MLLLQAEENDIVKLKKCIECGLNLGVAQMLYKV